MSEYARDPFGIEPLYWSQAGGDLVVSKSLPEMLERVPRDLDERTLLDFLAFGQNIDPARTFYRDVHRVPAGHRLIESDGAVRVERYWSLPQETIRIRERDAVERFRELFTRAVLDACGTDRVAVSMSGGVDSTAATAALVRLRRDNVSAVTVVYDRLIPDVERPWAQRAADALNIPIEFHIADDYELFERWDDPIVRGVEPLDDPVTARYVDTMRMLAARAPVALTGQGGDAVLYTSHSYFFDLLKRFRISRIVREAGRYALTRHHRPPLLFRSQFRRALGITKPPILPRWLRVDDELRDRWESFWNPNGPRLHPLRNEAARLITGVHWANSFEALSSSWTRLPLRIAAPYFDTRLVEFLFSLPPMPHFADKDILRRAMRGWLPDDIRLRPKTPLAEDPVLVLFNREPRKWIDVVMRSHALEPFIDKRAYRTIERFGFEETLPVVLAMWLEGQR